MSERPRALPYGAEDRYGHDPSREAEGLPYRAEVPYNQNAQARHPRRWRFADGAQLVELSDILSTASSTNILAIYAPLNMSYGYLEVLTTQSTETALSYMASMIKFNFVPSDPAPTRMDQ